MFTSITSLRDVPTLVASFTSQGKEGATHTVVGEGGIRVPVHLVLVAEPGVRHGDVHNDRRRVVVDDPRQRHRVKRRPQKQRDAAWTRPQSNKNSVS